MCDAGPVAYQYEDIIGVTSVCLRMDATKMLSLMETEECGSWSGVRKKRQGYGDAGFRGQCCTVTGLNDS